MTRPVRAMNGPPPGALRAGGIAWLLRADGRHVGPVLLLERSADGQWRGRRLYLLRWRSRLWGRAWGRAPGVYPATRLRMVESPGPELRALAVAAYDDRVRAL